MFLLPQAKKYNFLFLFLSYLSSVGLQTHTTIFPVVCIRFAKSLSVAFAQLSGFMEEKIKNFSSGMISRLGFAIATAGDAPEIQILDEVLSVGDMFFRKKSEQRIRELIRSGSTVLIVSHSTDAIIKNCTRAVWIEKGILRKDGDPAEVCAAYRRMEKEG